MGLFRQDLCSILFLTLVYLDVILIILGTIGFVLTREFFFVIHGAIRQGMNWKIIFIFGSNGSIFKYF